MNTASATPVSLPWIDRLLRIDTTSRNSNLGLIELARDHFARLGLETQLSYDSSGAKANLFATLSLDGRRDGGLVLSGHTDVVPVDGQDWSSDPFVPSTRDDRIYARGACDMKGFLGVAMTLIETAVTEKLRAPLHIAMSFDEELGCVGAPYMLRAMQEAGFRPASCVVGEPTSMQVVTAHKGINVYRCTVHGRAAHSSLRANGVNAIEYAARLICLISDMADECERLGPFDNAFDVPFTTAQTGVISGGIAQNTVPDLCEFLFEFRNLPSLEAAAFLERLEKYAHHELLPRMLARAPEAAIRFEKLAQAPAMESDEEAEITKLVRALVRDKDKRKVSYGTEGGQFQEAGVPTVICGPGDIRQAHRPDEFVALDQLVQCERFVTSLLESMRVKQ